MTEDGRLEQLARGLVAALRRDANQLEADGGPNLKRLADQLDVLVTQVAAAPSATGKRVLLQVLDEVEQFQARTRTSLDAARTALDGAAQRRLARRAYVEAERYGGGSA